MSASAKVASPAEAGSQRSGVSVSPCQADQSFEIPAECTPAGYADTEWQSRTMSVFISFHRISIKMAYQSILELMAMIQWPDSQQNRGRHRRPSAAIPEPLQSN